MREHKSEPGHRHDGPPGARHEPKHIAPPETVAPSSQAEEGATLAGPATLRPASLLPLQRAAGNRAVVRLVQRRAPAPAAAPPNNIDKLDELIDKWIVPRQQVVDLMGSMTAAEKATVRAGYRDKLASKLNFQQMKVAVTSLDADLPTKLDWMEKATFLGMTSLIRYDEIRDVVQGVPQAQKDLLKSGRWKSFFLSVCTNATIIPAVQDLNFDLVTQLTWVKGEASALFSLNLDKLRPLLTGRSATELATVSGDDWLPFWTDVCTNKTMEQLVQILFPGDLVKQLHFMIAEGTDAGLVKARLEAAPAAQRVLVYDTPEAVALIRGFNATELAAVVPALGGTPTQQLTLLGPTFPLSLLTWATPSQEWVDGLKSTRPDPLAVFMVAGNNLAWAPFIQTRLADLFRGKAATVFGPDMVTMIWTAYADGAVFNAADTLVVFRALFGRDVTAPGPVIFPTGTNKRDRYNAVAPDDATARELMKMVKTIPRSQVATAPIEFCDIGWHETNDPVAGWTGPLMTDFLTSFFWQDNIVIKVVGGHMDAGKVQTVGGEGTAYGAPGTTGPGGAFTSANALSYFQNHVRHEIGHAVGQRPIGKMTEAGDTFANTYGGWKPSSKGDFLANMWAPIAMPNAGWPSIDFGGGAVPVNDTQVRDWLVGLVGTGAEVGGPILNGTKTIRQKIDLIAGSIWGGQTLSSYVSNIRGNTAADIQDGAYQFPGFTPSEPVHIFSTRENNQFMTYSKAAHDALHTTTGWYSLSSHAEMFAEMYTRKYSGGGTPAAANSKDPAAFFVELEAQEDPMFGKPEGPAPTPEAPRAG